MTAHGYTLADEPELAAVLASTIPTPEHITVAALEGGDYNVWIRDPGTLTETLHRTSGPTIINVAADGTIHDAIWALHDIVVDRRTHTELAARADLLRVFRELWDAHEAAARTGGVPPDPADIAAHARLICDGT